jgi:hypothetical protein
MSRRRNLLLIVPALVAAGVATIVAGPAAATPLAAAAQAAIVNDDDKAFNAAGNGLVNCNGGAQESDLVRMNDLPTALVENAAFVTLTGAVINFVTPAMDSDQILVTFHGEAQLQGQNLNYLAPMDFLQVQILLDGVAMAPLNDLMFTTVAGEANSAAACKRVGAGNHTVEVQWLIIDQQGNNVTTGDLDDWLFEVQISN